MRDFYEVLGVERSATFVEIKKSYRTKAMKYHPDRNPGDKEAEEKFKELGQAYEILSDEQKRALYDQHGHQAFANGGAGAQGGFGFSGGFTDIFEEMFGNFMHGGQPRHQGRSQAVRGDDLRYDLELTLEEVYTGVSKEIAYRCAKACGDCDGSGAEGGASAKVTCETCHGSGTMRMQQGFFMIERPCHKCNGSGHMIKNVCKTCKGVGRKGEHCTLSVEVPKGIENDTRMRLTGKGDAGIDGGPAGDLYVFLHVLPHEMFERVDGKADLYCRIPIPMVTAVLGGDVEVPTIAGKKESLKISAGTQPGQKLRLKGQGMPHYNRPSYGDMIVEVQVEIPSHLSKKQIDVLKAFDNTLADKHHPTTSSFWKNVKKLWGE